MARYGSERGGLAGLLDRLLGRQPEERTSEVKPLFTAHQPPPARAEPEAAPEAAPADTAVEAPGEPEALDRTPTAAPADLFRDRPPRRSPRDAWEEEAERTAEPEPAPGPADGPLQTSVHTETIDQAAPRARDAPDVRVHDGHLEERSRPVELTPSQALELARGGRDALKRRDRGRD